MPDDGEICSLLPVSPPPSDQYFDFHHKKEVFPLQDICLVPDLLKKGGRGPPLLFDLHFFPQSHTREKSDVQTQRGLWTFFLFRCEQTEKNFFSLGKARTFNPPPPPSLPWGPPRSSKRDNRIIVQVEKEKGKNSLYWAPVPNGTT